MKYTDEEIQRAKNIDLKTYLEQEKGFTFIKKGSNYFWSEHDSFTVNPNTNLFYWHSQKFGGDLIKYLQLVENKTFVDAMKELVGNSKDSSINKSKDNTRSQVAKNYKVFEKKEEIINKKIEFPKRNKEPTNLYNYLVGVRKIDKKVVDYMVSNRFIYEDVKKNCVFVGYEKDDIKKLNPTYASLRSTTTDYRIDLKNSKKDTGFKFVGENAKTLIVTESPIDMLSAMTISVGNSTDISNLNENIYLSLGGLSDKALSKTLDEYKNIERVFLMLDTDDAGRNASNKLVDKYKDKISIDIFEFSNPYGLHLEKPKDINEFLILDKQKDADSKGIKNRKEKATTKIKEDIKNHEKNSNCISNNVRSM